MLWRKLVILILFFFVDFNSAFANSNELIVINGKSGKLQSYKIGRDVEIDIKFVEGWRSCRLRSPQSQYLDEIKMHLRKYTLQCETNEGALVAIVCTLSDQRGETDSAHLNLHSKDFERVGAVITKGNSALLSLTCSNPQR